MMCTFCGSENRPENRFCGMCGVRLERRQKERRAIQENIKCSACNHVNEVGQRFCGMCGGKIERRAQERRGSAGVWRAPANSLSGRAVAQANAQLPSPETPSVFTGSPRARAASSSPAVLNQMEPAEPAAVFRGYDQSSTIAGPSFLGLSSESQSQGEYLLEDESSSRSGLRKLVLLVVLLAIIGLIFVQWRANYNANPKPLEPPKPEPATVPRPQGKNQPPQPNGQEKDQVKNSAPSVTGNQADHDGKTQASETLAAASQTARSKDAGIATPVSEEVAARGEPKEKQLSRDRTGTPALSAEDAKKDIKSLDVKNRNAKNQDAKQDASDEAPSRSAKTRESPARREKPSMALVRAQRYLQGRGVRQSCEQGMMYLKAATQQNDPHAAVQMAALYASGHCVQRNRAKAYQWFASANSLEPGNQWIAKNMNQLWGQMTAQERRQFQ